MVNEKIENRETRATLQVLSRSNLSPIFHYAREIQDSGSLNRRG